MVRDEFTEDVKRTLAARVGNLCSNPACHALTSGPQVDPTKSLNVGVAAHLTAASPGGPRYDPALSPEERQHADNGIWLCQNCGKLVDNDPARYTESVLRQWKAEAEAEALSGVGKPCGLDLRSSSGQILRLPVAATIQIRPAIPRRAEQDLYQVKQIGPDYIVVYKISNHQDIEIPAAGTGPIYKTSERFVVMLQGRMQWITPSKRWTFLPEEPPKGPEGDWGLWKVVSLQDPEVNELSARLPCRWFREDGVPTFLARGWHIVYGKDGRYFRVRSRDSDLILMSQSP